MIRETYSGDPGAEHIIVASEEELNAKLPPIDWSLPQSPTPEQYAEMVKQMDEQDRRAFSGSWPPMPPPGLPEEPANAPR